MIPLRIMMITNNYHPYSGGVVSSIDTHAKNLRLLGHTVTIVTLDFAPSINQEAHVLRIPCPIKFMYKKNPMAIPFRASHYLRRWIKDYSPDIVHTHHPALLGTRGASIANRLNIPVIFTYHTLYEHYTHYFPIPTSITQNVIQKKVISYCKKVQGIIAPSDPVKKMVDRYDVSCPVKTIPSGIDSCYVRPLQVRRRQLDEPLRLLYVGRLVPEKKVLLLVQVLGILRDQNVPFEATFVGFGCDQETLERSARTMGLSPQQLKFVIKPEKSVIADYYQWADLFLFASSSDTQALVLAESMAGGTPVIALPGPGQEVLIEQGRNGFMVHSMQEMAEVIVSLQKNPELHASMQEHAWQTAQRYTPERTTAALVAFYREILGK